MDKVNANVFRTLVEAQKDLLYYYIQLENLPSYPVDIVKKPGQRIIKDFIHRYIEELCEAYEQLVIANVYIKEGDISSSRTHIANFNMEIADSWHFLLEVLIYSGIDCDTLEQGFLKHILQPNELMGFYVNERPLKSIYNLAAYYNEFDGYTKEKKSHVHFTVYSKSEVLENPLVAGGNIISDLMLTFHREFLWNITYNLNMLANTLKNRDWVQTEKDLNILKYQEDLIKCMVEIIRYMEFLGITEIPLHYIYLAKNKINKERIKNNY